MKSEVENNFLFIHEEVQLFPGICLRFTGPSFKMWNEGAVFYDLLKEKLNLFVQKTERDGLCSSEPQLKRNQRSPSKATT